MQASPNPLSLGEIEAELRSTPEHQGRVRIPRERVKSWMQSSDIEVLGAVWDLITEERHYRRIEPPLTLDDYHAFVKQYFARCLLEDPQGKWPDTRYSAGASLVNWFVQQWRDPGVPREIVADLKEWLAQLYRTGDDTLRESIVTAILEHLFEHSDVADYFSDWRKTPDLALAYEEAREYASHLREQAKYLDLQVDSVGDVIATRQLRIEGEDCRDITISIGRPQPYPNAPRYYCPYQIDGLASDRVRYAIGIDSVQAIQQAFEQIATELNVLSTIRGVTMIWPSGQRRDTGFPPSRNA